MASPNAVTTSHDSVDRLADSSANQSAEDIRPGEWLRPDSELYKGLIRLAQRQLPGRGHLAEDAVARSLIRWKGLDPTSKSAEKARIAMIVKSEAASLARSERRREARQRRAEGDRSADLNARPGVVRSLPAEVPSLEQYEAQQVLTALLSKLPWPQRECIELVVLDGYSVREVAERLQLSVQTVRRQLFAARQQLKALLERESL